MRKIWIAAAVLALLAGTASAQNMSLRAPSWAQSLVSADTTPTTGGRAALQDAGITYAVRVTIAPLQGGVSRGTHQRDGGFGGPIRRW